jgi:tight adherence protein B
VVGLILLGSFLGTVILVYAARDLASAPSARRQAVAAIIGEQTLRGLPPIERYDRLFRATRLGRRLDRELALAAIKQRPIVVFAGGVGVAVIATVLIWQLLAPVLAVLGIGVGFLVVRAYLKRERTRRLEAFIVQMPELARVLANSTNAGLSIRTAIATAGEELGDPASVEMRRVATRVSFGATLDDALSELTERLPSREVALLTATLIVSARSGGSMVTALRDIADTLEARKETRREIQTTLSEALATGYAIVGLGGVILLLLNGLYSGVVAEMTQEPVGQVALVVVGALYLGGLVFIRRITKFDA